jgi:hypothetical protein
MVLSQISLRMLETTLILIDSHTPLFDCLASLRNTQILLIWTNGRNQPMPSPRMTHAVFSLRRVSPILSSNLSVSLSLSLALFLVMFYLSWFPLNTRQLKCIIIIHINKLIQTTSLFHLKAAHNMYYFLSTFSCCWYISNFVSFHSAKLI